MNAAQLSSRAVLGAYARRALRPIVLIVAVVLVFIMLLIGYLAANVSAWWLVMLLPVVVVSAVATTLWAIVRLVISRLTPAQTILQKKAVGTFVTLVDKNANLLGLSKLGIIIQVIRDVMAHSDSNIISRTIGDSKELATSFKQVINSFK